MPAAAVIPAPIAYTIVVAVKKLVVGSRCPAIGPPQGVSLVVLRYIRRLSGCVLFIECQFCAASLL